MINLDYLGQNYFSFDEPVPYKLSSNYIYIKPINLKDSNIFLSSVDILNIDKNSYPDPKIIQMSYLQFICEVILLNKKDKDIAIYKLYNILKLCLNMQSPEIMYIDMGIPCLYDAQNPKNIIKPKQFDDIKKIILYQNFIHYDDSYINPDLKEAMESTDEARNKGIKMPTLERQIAIITAHTGLSKKEQLQMTYRSHTLLFEEVCGEVDFTTIRPVALLSGSKQEFDHWIFKKDIDKFSGYIKSVDSYTKSVGSGIAVKSSNTTMGDSYIQQYDDFSKK